MDVTRAARLVMAKMALADGTVSDDEKEMLGSDDYEQLIEEALRLDLPELLEAVTVYADRFFIAMRAAALAHVDATLDEREEALYERLVKFLAITPEDQAVIDRCMHAIATHASEAPEARILELFQQSSFAA